MVWCVSVLADVSNERSFPSSVPSIKRLLPLQSFTRGLILYEVDAAACSSASASNADVPFGAAHISALFLFLSSSSSHSLLFAPLFKSSQASASLCLFSLSSFKSRQVGPNSLAVFPLFLIHFLVFFPRLLSLSLSLSFYLLVSPNCTERNP